MERFERKRSETDVAQAFVLGSGSRLGVDVAYEAVEEVGVSERAAKLALWQLADLRRIDMALDGTISKLQSDSPAVVPSESHDLNPSAQ